MIKTRHDVELLLHRSTLFVIEIRRATGVEDLSSDKRVMESVNLYIIIKDMVNQVDERSELKQFLP